MDFTENLMDNSKFQCGQIFLALNGQVSSYEIIINCTLCEEIDFKTYAEYKEHLLEHYPELQINENFENEQSNSSVSNGIDNLLDDSFVELTKTLEKTLTEVTEKKCSMHKFVPLETPALKNPHQCTKCGRNFALLSSLKCHLSKCSTNACLYKCDVCKSGFDLKSAFLAHSKTHSKQKIVVNRSEDAEASCQEDLSVAVEVEAANINTTRETSKSPCMLIESETPSNADPIPCSICTKTFNTERQFNAHMKRHRPSVLKCTFDTCLKEFKTAAELKTHTRFHTGERPYLCAECGQSFVTISKLHNHTRRHHTHERKIQCSICKRKFYVAGELKAHLITMHTNDRPFKCKLCPATFNRRYSLRAHINSHENRRQYKCNFCTASFNQKCNLNAHKKKTHCLVINLTKG